MPPPPHQRMRRCKAAIKPVCACCSLLASLPTMQPNYQHNRGCVTSQNFNYTGWSAADSERHSTRNGDSLLEKTNSLLKAPQGRKHDDTTIGWDRVSGIWMQTESERCQHRTRQLTCLHTFYSASQLQIVISGNTQQLKQNTRKCKAQKLPWWFAKLRSGFHIFCKTLLPKCNFSKKCGKQSNDCQKYISNYQESKRQLRRWLPVQFASIGGCTMVSNVQLSKEVMAHVCSLPWSNIPRGNSRCPVCGVRAYKHSSSAVSIHDELRTSKSCNLKQRKNHLLTANCDSKRFKRAICCRAAGVPASRAVTNRAVHMACMSQATSTTEHHQCKADF